MLGILGLILRRIGHGDRRAIDERDSVAVEEPGVGGLLLESVGGVADQPGQERLGQTLARLAVAAGVRRAGGQPARGTPGDQPVEGGLAGVIVAEDLTQKGTERHEGGEDAVAGLAHLLGDDLDEMLGRKEMTEEEPWIEDEGSQQTAELSQRSGGVRIRQERPSLLVEDGGTSSIGGKAGLSCISSGVEKSCDPVSAIRLWETLRDELLRESSGERTCAVEGR